MHTSQLNPVLDTPIEMNAFLILLALGYASSNKLDLSYLPPPGSQYSGGRPGDIQVPLEFPKETYTTTLRPQSGGLRPEDYKPTIGIDRVPGVQEIGFVTPGSTPLPQNTQRVPTTTVSYAFTQTTTHPPTEGFETTLGPQITEGFPTTDGFNNFPSQEPGLGYDESLNVQNRPGYQQTVNQFGQRPTAAPTSGPVYNNLPSQGPGFVHGGNLNQFGQPTLAPTSGPLSQITGSLIQPVGTGQFGQNRPDQQQVLSPGSVNTGNFNQFGQPTLEPISPTGSPIPSLGGQQFENRRPGQQQVLNQIQPGYQQPGNIPQGSQTPFEQNQYRNQTLYGDRGIGNQPGFISSAIGQGIPSTSQPSTIYGDNISHIPGVIDKDFRGQVQSGYQPGSNLQPSSIPGQQLYGKQQFPGSQSQYVGSENRQPSSTVAPTFTPGFPNQQTPGASIAPNTDYPGAQYIGGDNAGQQYPGSQGSSIDGKMVFQSTVAPSFGPGAPNQDLLPGQRGQQYPTSITPSHSTPGYPTNAAPSVYQQRPERPQAESDRNAVILNYDNVITPEGFAYSFDTSNGIHADESGTATDGVKAKGSYSYIGDDGNVYSIVYTADEDGYRPQGDHLPTSPPIPEAIQRVIDQVQKEKEAGISDDGSYNEAKYGHQKYQSRKPQFSDKVKVSEGANVPEGSVIDSKEERLEKHRKPQITQNRPTISDNNEDNQEPELSNANQRTQGLVSKGGSRRPGYASSTQRPVDRVTVDVDDNEGGDLEGIIDQGSKQDQLPANRPFAENASKRPTNQSVRKQYNKNNIPVSGGATINSDRRRPVGQKQSPDEYTSYDGPKYNTRNRYENKPSRRPVNYEEGNQYEDGETIAPGDDDFEDETVSRRPGVSGPSRQPSTIIKEGNGQETFDKYGRPIVKAPIRRPIGSRKPSNKPSTYSPDEPESEDDDYSSAEEYVTKSPTRTRPGTSQKYPYRPIGSRRRPGTTGLRVHEQVESGEELPYQPEDSDEYIESNVEDNEEPQDYDNQHITSSTGTVPGRTSSDRYEEGQDQDQGSDYYGPAQEDLLARPKPSKYGGSRGRPQPSKTTIDSKDSQLDAPRSGTKFGQKTVRPSPNYQNTFVDKKDYEKRPLNETGYQYIPPVRKFEQDEVRGFPARQGTTIRPYTGRPTESTEYYDNNGPTGSGKPFMTPNVPHVGSDHIEDHDDENSQYPDDASTPDQVFGDEDHSTRPTHKLSSSNKRPIQQYTTGRPQYYEEPENGYTKEQVIQKGKPSQGSSNRYYEGTKRPYGGGVTSTTPLPSGRPDQQDQTYYSNGNIKKIPGQSYISSTTSLPTQTSDGAYQQDTIEPQYRPTEYDDQAIVEKFPTVRPTDFATGTPGAFKNRYLENLPSTTYRPNYTVRGQHQPSSTARPSVPVDRYGRPITKPDQEYTPGNALQPTSTLRPAVTVDMYGRPIRPGFGTTSEEFVTGDLNEPSSTVTPGVLVDAFGRPVKPGGSTQQYIPSSTLRPSVTIDEFGRPVNQPAYGGEYLQNGKIQPSTTARPGVPVDAYGRPITPGSIAQPELTTPAGSVVQDVTGNRIAGQYQPSVVPSSGQQYVQGTPTIDDYEHPTTVSIAPGGPFRGNQRYQPAGLPSHPAVTQVSSTFQPSTERNVIGEDFSGPKRQQKFDPKRGYYYE